MCSAGTPASISRCTTCSAWSCVSKIPTTMSCAVVYAASAAVIGPSLRRSLSHAGLSLADPDRPLLGVRRLGQHQRQDAVLVLRARILRVDVGRQHYLLAERPAAEALIEG